MKTRLNILLSPLFLISLSLLLINDFWLKSAFHNWLTGKLSDFSGLFALTLFLIAFFPKQKRSIPILIGICFVFWKSTVSQSLIDFSNSILPFQIGRTPDLSDLIALSVLPLAYFSQFDLNRTVLRQNLFVKQIAVAVVVLISVFAFTATSFKDDRNVLLEKAYVFKGSQAELTEKLKNLEIVKDLEVTRETETFTTLPEDDRKNLNPNKYYFTFDIDFKFCDSQDIRISASGEEKNNAVHFYYIHLRFWCKQEPTEKTNQLMSEIFEREIAEKLELTDITDLKNKGNQ